MAQITEKQFLDIPTKFTFLADGFDGNMYSYIEYKRINGGIVSRESTPLTETKSKVLSISATFLNGKHYEKINDKWILKGTNWGIAV